MSKILVVDDSQSFLDLVEILLKGSFELSFARSAIEAINMVKSNSYDALILDMSLPDYTGYYLGEKIRKERPDIPIAFLTNYDGETSRETADILNAKFWYKPNVVASNGVLLESVKNLLNNV